MAVQNNLVEKTQKQTFSTWMASDAIKNKINEMTGGKNSNFCTAIISAVSVNPMLAECEHSSILASALLGESLKLSPSPQLGQYYLVPFKNKKKDITEAQFILGYKGYIQLATRSGQYRDIDVIEIREGEYKGKDRYTGKAIVEFIEDDDIRETKNIIGYFAFFEYLNGFKKSLYWSKEKMIKHADTYSPAFSATNYTKIINGEIKSEDLWKYSSYWYKDFDGMAYKTLLRQLISKWGIMSIDMQRAFEIDLQEEQAKETVVSPVNDFFDIDNSQQEMEDSENGKTE